MTVAAALPPEEVCRLCGGTVCIRFRLRVLDRLDVSYFECRSCGSLQTERPHWLEEAYSGNLAVLDTGAAQRNITNLAASYLVARLGGLRDVIDFGGGDGLLCRLLRDYGINCFVTDKHASAGYAQGFTQPNFNRPELLLLFEVAEHFAEPRNEFDALFARRPKAFLMSTELYHRQGSEWPYLTAQMGQHVFFYSRMALEILARERGYRAFFRHPFVLMVDPQGMGTAKGLAIAVLLRRLPLRLCRILMGFIPARGVAADYERLRDSKVARNT